MKRKINILVFFVIAFIISIYIINWHKYTSKLSDNSKVFLVTPGSYNNIMYYYNIITSVKERPAAETIKKILKTSPEQYVPFYFTALAFTSYLLDRDLPHAILLVNVFYLTIALIFMYFLGRKIKDEKTGLLSVLLIAFYPLIIMYQRVYCMEISITAFAAMTLYFLLMTENFSKLKWVILFAVSAVLGMLHKNVYAAFVLCPIGICLFSRKGVLKNETVTRNSKWINFAIATLIVFAMLFPTYWDFEFLECLINYPFVEVEAEVWYKKDSLKLILPGLWNNQLGIPFFIIFVVGLFKFIKEKHLRLVMFFASSVLFPVVFFSLMPHWITDRYLIPYMPVLAVISGYGISTLWHKKMIRITLITLLIVGSIWSIRTYFKNDRTVLFKPQDWFSSKTGKLNEYSDVLDDVMDRFSEIYPQSKTDNEIEHKKVLYFPYQKMLTVRFTEFIDIAFWQSEIPVKPNFTFTEHFFLEDLENLYDNPQKTDSILYIRFEGWPEFESDEYFNLLKKHIEELDLLYKNMFTAGYETPTIPDDYDWDILKNKRKKFLDNSDIVKVYYEYINGVLTEK